MTRPAQCYVCGSAKLADGADLRSPLCGRCAPARSHIVSMKRSGSHRTAECRCGWDYAEPIGAADQRDEVVRGHWRQVVEQAG